MSSISTNFISTCANCGKGGEEDSTQLKSCAACKLVKYCSRECQIAHRPQHKKECKKRAAKLHDEALFKQPPPNEECPICCLQLPALDTGYRYMSCCGKRVCSGCVHAVQIRSKGIGLCPFCRTPTPSSEKEMLIRGNKRVALGDAAAIFILGCMYDRGLHGLPQDSNKALELYHQAGELGYGEAYLNLGNEYARGVCVEKDRKKAIHYWELAAMGGSTYATQARYNLGVFEEQEGNWDKVLNHYMIAAGSGYKKSLEEIKELYTNGHAAKDDYAKALRAYQSYLDEIKSVQRDEAAAFSDEFKYHY